MHFITIHQGSVPFISSQTEQPFYWMSAVQIVLKILSSQPENVTIWPTFVIMTFMLYIAILYNNGTPTLLKSRKSKYSILDTIIFQNKPEVMFANICSCNIPHRTVSFKVRNAKFVYGKKYIIKVPSAIRMSLLL